jgi:hypothetical protein
VLHKKKKRKKERLQIPLIYSPMLEENDSRRIKNENIHYRYKTEESMKA